MSLDKASSIKHSGNNLQTYSNSLPRFIWHFIKKQKGLFFIIQFFCLAWTIDHVLWPIVFGMFIDKITNYPGGDVWAYLALPIGLGLALWITIEIFYRLAGFIQAIAFPKLEADIRMSLFDYVQDHSYSYFASNFSGSIANKISDMTLGVTRIVQQTVQLFIPVIIGLISSTLLFIFVQPLFGIILGAWIIVHVSICLFFARKCDRFSHIHSESRSLLVGKIVDSLTNHINTRLFSRKRFELDYLKKYQAEEQKKNVESLWIIEKMKIYLGLASLIGPGLLLNWYMIYSWGQGYITAGEVVFIFNSSWNVMMMAWFAGLEIPLFFKEVGTCRQALSLINHPHDIVDKPNAAPLKVTKGEITFENVSFKYSPQSSIFKDKTLTIKAGEKVGLVGFSGSGKTTFVHLILRYYDVQSGKIKIDGQDISHIKLDSLRDNIALIPQDPSLFHRTIWENIHYGNPNASPDEVLHASQQAHADEFIMKMPEKYKSLVGERGVKLSGGQKQRIAIARAILKNAPILILDEATSALDSVTEKCIQESLTELMQGKTSIVIAHRLSTLSGMDRILVFDQGNIIEEGTHDELIQAGGHYSMMWTMQAGGFLPSSLDGEEDEEEEEF